MATMKRCLAQLSLSGRWGSEHFWPGLDVDLDRVLAPAIEATRAVGLEGQPDYVAPRPALAAVRVRDAIAGREDCFVDVFVSVDAGAAPAGFRHVDVPDGTDFTHTTIRAIAPKDEE